MSHLFIANVPTTGVLEAKRPDTNCLVFKHVRNNKSKQDYKWAVTIPGTHTYRMCQLCILSIMDSEKYHYNCFSGDTSTCYKCCCSHHHAIYVHVVALPSFPIGLNGHCSRAHCSTLFSLQSVDGWVKKFIVYEIVSYFLFT